MAKIAMGGNQNGTNPSSTSLENLTAELYIDNLPHWVHLLGFVLYVILLGLALAANAVILFVFYRIKEIRNVTNNLLCNMVGANVLFALQTPMEAVSILNDSWDLGNIPCKIHRWLLYTFYNVSILSFTAISTERYYAICSPMRFNTDLEKNSTKLILSMWILATLLSLPQIVVSSAITTDRKIACMEEQPGENYIVVFLCYHVPNFFFLYVVPLGILLVTYLRVSRKLYNLVERYRQRSRFDICGAVKMRKNTIRMLLVVLVVFFLCLTPFKIVEFLHVTPVLKSYDPFGILHVSVSMIAFSYALFNPLVCSFMSREFRKATKKAFSCVINLRFRLQKQQYAENGFKLQEIRHNETKGEIVKEGLANEGFTLSFETLTPHKS